MPDIIRAIILMIVSMFFFTIADLFVKLASQTLPSEVVLTAMGLGTTLLFYGLLRAQGQPVVVKDYFHSSVIIRTIGEVVAAVGIIISLSVVPLATVTAIMQSQPLLVTVAGALFLKEKVGVRRISAVLIGLVGVLFIIRPGMGDFSIYSWFVIIGVVGMTVRDVGSRVVPSAIPTLAVVLMGAIGVTLTGGAMMAYSGVFVMPQGIAWFYVIGMIFGGTCGVYFITNAMRLGEVSIVSPFRYVKIIFGMGAGVLFFGEHIDALTMCGTLIVTAAGIYAFMRERALLKQAMAVAGRG